MRYCRVSRSDGRMFSIVLEISGMFLIVLEFHGGMFMIVLECLGGMFSILLDRLSGMGSGASLVVESVI
jgi:hypothetical protein